VDTGTARRRPDVTSTDLSATAATSLSGYRRLVRRRVLLAAGLAALAVAAFLADVVTGPSDLHPLQLLGGLFAPDSVSRPVQTIIWQVRLPYALMAVLVGAALAVSGAEMQTTLNNYLASPFTLGIASAASFGAALAIILGFGLPGIPQNWVLSANAFVFAFASILFLQAVSRLRGAGAETVVLLGIALSFTFNALLTLVQFVASPQALQQVIFWMMGSLTRSTWDKLAVLVVVLALALPFSFAASAKLTALRLGEERARSFGVNVGRLRFGSLFRVSLLTATSMAFVGTIGFIGLVSPHIARLLVGEDHRFLLPVSALTGAVLMSGASIVSKSVLPGVLLPIGMITALIGLPVFAWLIFTRGRA